MTGAPIYLVSACASGEEFVAAFRRYADKNGLFVPISEPLPIGCRSRFAVTLKDGGVMIEGEAEIISSAPTASVLHGRVGMTLRFIEPDDASKTMLGELEKARLSMRPAPPSVSPRPAELPAEPRPVPPPVQGRIDAVNALAECVAIGDTGALVPPASTTSIVTPQKAGPRFVVPAAPAVPPAMGPGVAPRTTTSPRPTTPARPTTPPQPIGIAKPDERDERDERKDTIPPSTTPHAAPQREQLRNDLERRSDPAQAVSAISGFSQTMTAVALPLDPGPASDTMVAVTPPEPPAATPSAMAPRHAVEMQAVTPRSTTKPHAVSPPAAPAAVAPALPLAQPAEPTRHDTAPDMMNAVPISSTTAPSAPTEIGGVPVDPLRSTERVGSTLSPDDQSSRTQVHAGAPPREPPASPSREAETSSPREAQASPPREAQTSPPREAQTSVEDVEAADSEMLSSRGATHIGMPPVPRGPAPVSPLPTVLSPAPPIVAPERPAVPEVEIAEPTDLSIGPPEPPAEPPPPEAVAPHPPERPSPIPRQRKTVIGVVIPPSGVAVLPATTATAAGDPGDESLFAALEATGADRIAIGDSTADTTTPTAPPEPRLPARLDEATPGNAQAKPPGRAMPASLPGKAPAEPAPTEPATPAATLPSGDWTIALDPQAPDGWSEPVQAISPERVTEAPPSGPAPAVVASAQPRVPAPKPPVLPPDPLPIAEPKVQIDPTLIEPLRSMPSDPPLRPMPPDVPWQAMPPDDPFRDAAASAPGMPSYGVPPGAVAGSAPPMNMMPPVPQPNPFLVPYGQPAMHTGEAPAYPMDPSYQMMPVAGVAAPGSLTAGGSGLGDPRYSSESALPAQPGRRRLVIVIVSALVAVAIGIAVLAAMSRKHGPGTPPGTEVEKPRPPPAEAPKPPKASALTTDPTHVPPSAPATTTDPAHAAPQPPPESPTTAPGDTTAAARSDEVAGAAPLEPTTCSAEVTSVPIGAEIVLASNVVGTTPQKIPLPCGDPVELVIRKGRFIAATRTVTPTADGAKLKVALAKPTFLLKVSSMPAGATITMNGKPLGISPTTVKVPAFEASTLTITKDGYATATERVAPKSNGVAVHTTLKRLERKKPH